MLRGIRIAAVVCVAAAGVTGCAGTSGEDRNARAAAESFLHALAAQDGSAACELLAAGTRVELEDQAGSGCADAVVALGLGAGGEVQSARAYGRAAQVVLDSDVLFLTLAPSGWQVTAAGCAPRPELPYDCDLKGE